MNRTDFENKHSLTITQRGWLVFGVLTVLIMLFLLAVVGGIEQP